MRPGGIVDGHLDNFVGVHAMMRAFFSGRLDRDDVRVELTWGEEKGLLGAQEVAVSLRADDVAIVIDVTGTPTDRDFVVEKCAHPRLRAWLTAALGNLAYDLYPGCPDPVSDQDECEIYRLVTPYTCFLGVPVTGGDYNLGRVRTRVTSIEAVTEAICRLTEAFSCF